MMPLNCCFVYLEKGLLFSLCRQRLKPLLRLLGFSAFSVLPCQWAGAASVLKVLEVPSLTLQTINQQTVLQIWSAFAILLLLLLLLVIYLLRARGSVAQSFQQTQQISQALKVSTDKLAYMVATSPTVLFAMKIKGKQLQTYWVSDNLTRMTGYTQAEAMSPNWWLTNLSPEDRIRIGNESMALFLGKHMVYEYRFKHFNGSILWIHDEQQVVFDDFGKPHEVLCAWTDITDSKQKESNLKIAAIAFETKDSIMITDHHNRIIRVNRAFTRLTGYREDEVLGQTPSILKSGRHNDSFYQKMWQDLTQLQHWEGEIWNKHKDGESYLEWLVITAVKDFLGEVSHYVATCFDITERKQTEEYIRNLAYYDSLTGLPNRRLMLDRLGIALATSNRSLHYGALMFMDLDRFKILNDTQGHDMGDRLLIEVSKRLQACIREGDTVARLGGDEFVVMLENLSEASRDAAVQAQKIAEKIRLVLSEVYHLPLESNKSAQTYIEHHSSASVGLVLFCGHKVASEDLLKYADMAMYHAKHAGRDAVRVFDPAMQTALNERTALEADLRQALAKNELYLHYQVQVDVNGLAVGAEALLRWRHPIRGEVMPLQFIPLAEETGLILSIGRWVIEQGCLTLSQWAKMPAMKSLKLAVNVSPRQFRQQDFVEQIAAAVVKSGAIPALLKLEITESLIMVNLQDTVEKMKALKTLGIGFSMDDFGTGYSSLSYIQQMPLDQLKIDQSFVRDLADDRQDAAIVKTILALGRSLEMTVIAEGVETVVQRDYLAEYGCPVYQGYYFGKPIPLKELEASLAVVWVAD